MTPQERKTRIRLRDDFEFWAANAYTIVTKDGVFAKLVLNTAQKQLLAVIERQRKAEQPIRIVILKGRQQGASTLIEAWMLWRTTQHKAKRAFVLAQDAVASDTLFGQSKLGYEKLPELLKVSTKFSNKRELVFGELGSSLTVATAGGDSVGRSKTLQYVHASEVGFWPPSSAEKNWNGLNQCVPNVPDSAIFVESTAQGMGGLFHRLFTDAEGGRNGFEAVFLSWYDQPEYRKPAPPNFERSPEESYLAETHGLDDDQLWWRQGKIGETSRDMFAQEYPCSPTDAFLTSGRPVFDQSTLYRLIQDAESPVARMALEEVHGREEFIADDRGELSIWVQPDPDQTYYIGADVAEGVSGGDYSVAQVLDGNRDQVAVWRGHILPDRFANVLAALGYLYNVALVAVELNNHGLTTATELTKHLDYPSVFTDRVYDQISDKETVRMGFRTDPKTRPLILNKLRGEVRDQTITLRDVVTLKEMLSFVVNATGRMEAERGAHDDHVMSLAIANHVNEGSWTPYSNQPDWLHEAL